MHPVGAVLAGRDADRARRARRIAAWPSTSSGLRRLLDPAQVERLRAARTHSIASVDVPHLVGVGHQRRRRRRAPRASRSQRRTSAGMSMPTFVLKLVQPSASAARHSVADLVLGVAEPAGRRDVRRVAVAPQLLGAASAARRLERAQHVDRLVRRERVGDVAEVDARRRAAPASCRQTSCHTGLPSRLAHRSHTALTSAAVARWITPFSGPSQRSWLSLVSRRHEAGHVAGELVEVAARRRGARAPRWRRRHRSLPRPMVKVKPWPADVRSSVCEDDVGGRVVGIGVRRVRAGERPRRAARTSCVRTPVTRMMASTLFEGGRRESGGDRHGRRVRHRVRDRAASRA